MTLAETGDVWQYCCSWIRICLIWSGLCAVLLLLDKNLPHLKWFVCRCWRLFNWRRPGVAQSHWEAAEAQICDWFTGLGACHCTGLHQTGENCCLGHEHSNSLCPFCSLQDFNVYNKSICIIKYQSQQLRHLTFRGVLPLFVPVFICIL